MASNTRIGEHWPYVREMADRMSIQKRLTEAELAAEYWSLTYFMSGAQFNEVSSGQPYSEEFWEAHYDRSNALHRFATLPHYDKVTP